MEKKPVVIIADKWDAPYVHKFRKFFSGCALTVECREIRMLVEVQMLCHKVGADSVLTSSQVLLKKLLASHDPGLEKDQSIDKYKGSVFYIPATSMYPRVRVLIAPTPSLLVYKPELDFLVSRWAQKLTNPNFPVFPEMEWEVLGPGTVDGFLFMAQDALLMSVDIETAKKPVDPTICTSTKREFKGIWVLAKPSASSKKLIPVAPIITMVGYSILLKRKDGSLYSKTGVLHINSMNDIEYMRKFNLLPVPKVLQNGGYDSTYFLRYGAPLHNYVYDTFIAMHAWYAELQRTLAFIAAFFDRDYIYWKDEGERNMAKYNAKDCHNTLWAWVHLVDQWPEWAQRNYAENFRMQFPCIQCGAEGFLVDMEERKRLATERYINIASNMAKLEKLIAPGFNPNSPVQVLKVMKGLGYLKAKGSDDKELQAFRESHVIYEIVGDLISRVREDRKAVSTYFEATLLNDRLLSELNPGGTDSGRLASKASNLWCGTQIQNIPLYAKSMLIADPGWELNNCDAAQSESRTTAYMSEDLNLIAAVESPLDFHKTNATKFFGIHYDLITKEIRDLGKKVGHGANYNMGARVLYQTMGRKNVLKAQKLLKLPASMGVLDVCAYLLSCFDKAYPNIRGKFYSEIITEIQTTGMLVGPTGWVRRCFGNPANSKPELNSYVAHGPQSFSVKILNEAFFEAWRYQIRTSKIRLKAQVHDDIIWQSRPEHTAESAEYISKLMMKPYVVRGRVMIIPNEPATGKQNWKALK